MSLLKRYNNTSFGTKRNLMYRGLSERYYVDVSQQ